MNWVIEMNYYFNKMSTIKETYVKNISFSFPSASFNGHLVHFAGTEMGTERVQIGSGGRRRFDSRPQKRSEIKEATRRKNDRQLQHHKQSHQQQQQHRLHKPGKPGRRGVDLGHLYAVPSSLMCRT